MSDSHFEKADKKMMDAMKALREKRVSDGILKGFSASVERRILAKGTGPHPRPAFRATWVPVLAVMVLASLAVSRVQTSSKLTDIEEEIAALKEVGAWSDEDESVLGNSEDTDAQVLELSAGMSGGPPNIA